MKIKNLPLVVGISLPIVFIAIVSVIAFGPSLFIKPEHNFIYTTDDRYSGYNYGYNQYRNTYVVEFNRITLEPLPTKETETYKGDMPPLYLYNVKTDSSHQISFEEAKQFSVDAGPSSPDGYTVSYQYEHDGIFELFGSNGNDNGYFISKGNGKKRLSGLTSNGYSYSSSGNFKVIGWIK